MEKWLIINKPAPSARKNGKVTGACAAAMLNLNCRKLRVLLLHGR
jgi:hypothetical protein